MTPHDPESLHDDDPEALIKVPASASALPPHDLEEDPEETEDEDSSGEESTYESHVARMNMEYTLEYDSFERSLTPEQRALLGSSAVPDLPSFQVRGKSRREVIGISRDAADSSSASFTQDFSAAIDSIADEIQERFLPHSPKLAADIARWHEERVALESEKRKAGVIITIAGAFLGDSNVKLLCAGLAYATDLAITSGMGTMQAWAVKTGLSKQAISKKAKWWQKSLGLPGGSHMRDEETCASYSRAQSDKHWRNTRYGNA